MSDGITVVDVCRRMGVEPETDLMWSVGNAVRRRYEARYGRLPPKQLRQKTGGGGSHCFAIYPHEWEPVIAEVIRAHGGQKQRQGDLFG
jgi:hypothetical protein